MTAFFHPHEPDSHDEKKPATGLRPWLVFNCVLQQSSKFD